MNEKREHDPGVSLRTLWTAKHSRETLETTCSCFPKIIVVVINFLNCDYSER